MTIPFEFYFDSFLLKLITGAAWRNAVAAKHPGDPRNLKAASELSRLAKGRFSDVTPATWDAITTHLNRPYIAEAINLAVRSVGFRSRPSGIDEFINTISDAARALAQPTSIGGAA
jgi:hypothetical protein